MTLRTRGILITLCASFLYGVLPAVMQRSYVAGGTMESVTAPKQLFGLILIWLYIFATKKQWRVSRGDFLRLMGTGVIVTVMLYFVNNSFSYAPGSVCMVLFFLYVPIVNVLEMLMGRQRFTAIRACCLALTLGGMFFVVMMPDGGLAISTKGLVLAICGALSYGAWVLIMGAPRLKGVPPEAMTGYCFLVPVAVLVTHCGVTGQSLVPENRVQFVCFLVLGFGSSFLAPIFFLKGVRAIGASNAGIIDTIEPVIAYAAGVLVMGETITGRSAFGCALVIGGLLLLNLTQQMAPRAMGAGPPEDPDAAGLPGAPGDPPPPACETDKHVV